MKNLEIMSKQFSWKHETGLLQEQTRTGKTDNIVDAG